MGGRIMAAGNQTGHGWVGGRERDPVRRSGKKKQELNPAERRRAIQLIVCLILFAVVFAGRGITIGKVGQIGDVLAGIVDANTDFRVAFDKVGQSVSEGEPVTETFGVLWSEVFGGGKTGEQDQAQQTQSTQNDETGQSEQSAPTSQVGSQDAAATEKTSTEQSEENEGTTAGETSAAKAGTQTAEQSPTASLLDDTVTPVMGVLTSGFGYRTHPVDGEWKYHYGVDIQADTGTPILAFADGVVDYIGESDSYGLYLQLKHADNVTSFYAHCSDICVKTGQTVSAGQKIAEVGETGDATGPHLHFELKKDGEHLDPALYIQTEK